MFNEIDNLLGLDTILNGEPIGLRKYASQRRGINIRENSNRGHIRS